MREKLIKLLIDWGTKNNDSLDTESVADYLLANGVTVVKHGKWKNHYCSVCANINPTITEDFYENYISRPLDYCPNCGAKMDGGKEDKMYIADVSWGKDSLAMLLYILDHPETYPLSEVVFYNTGMEFEAIYKIRDKMLPILRERGIKYTELHPENPFIYDMLKRPVESKQKGKHNGYGWCGGVCRWGTTKKTQTLDAYAKCAKVHYIGIAADETKRIERLSEPKYAPLYTANMTEADCLDYCRQRGWNWNEATTETDSGYIDLYDILDRVSCWCCANKNKKELQNIWRYLPQYWEKLKEIQSQLERPMKKWKNMKYGEYGNVFEMEKMFRAKEKNHE